MTYTLAWLSHRTAQRIDLERIWKEQKLSDALCETITVVSKHAYDHIVNPPPNRRNPGEWSKREECWDAFRDKSIQITSKLEHELLDTSRPTAARHLSSAGASVPDAKAEAEIQKVMEVPAETWFKISRWAKETDNLLPWQRGLAFSLGRLVHNKKPPRQNRLPMGSRFSTSLSAADFERIRDDRQWCDFKVMHFCRAPSRTRHVFRRLARHRLPSS